MRYKRVLGLALCLMAAFCMILTADVHAESKEHKVVRVGWYDSPFHSMDQFGRRSGYGYDYQQRVATFTDWKYEYVEGSWPELFTMLQAGEIDLLSDVSYTPERAEKILYSDEAMGAEAYHAFVATDNTEIRPDDVTTLNGKRIGVDKNSIQEQIFANWAADRGLDTEIVELTAGAAEELELLGNGWIDVLVTLDSYESIGGMVPVFKIGSSDFFFGINKARPDLKEDLDAAMSRLLEVDHDLNRRLSDKYNKSVAVNSYLTFDEKKWLDSHGAIIVGYRDGFMPYCGSDETDGTLTGALADFLSYASTCEKNATLDFETRAFATTQEAMQALAAGEIDCVFPVSLSAYDGEQLGVIVTDPFISTEMFAVVRTGDRQGVSPDMDMTVAVIRGHLNHETFLKDQFPGWEIRFYDTAEDCFEAVYKGEADCTLVSNYRINNVSKLYSKYRLSALATGSDMDLAFAIRGSDDRLYSILSKVNRLVPFSMKNSSLTAYSFTDDKVTFLDYLRDNMAMVVTVASTIVIVILLLALRSSMAVAKARERREIISEAEKDPLTDLYNRNFFMVYTNRFYKDHPDVPMDAIVLNIERFHTLNALNGHEFCDDVLRELGSEIRSFVLETGDIAGRVGSDHFDIFCGHRDDYGRILERFQTVMDAFSDSADIRLRMGVAPCQEGVHPERLFARAWSACSQARGDIKSKYAVYDEEMRRREEHSQRLQNDLLRALDGNELEVYYQPKYNIQADPPRLNSAEALVRWNHPELGMVSPGEFIPLFEKSGQISDLDRYVWREAARQVAAWREHFGIELPVSVNLSRVDVFDPDLDEVLDGIIERYGLNRSTLKLEVTESAYTDNADELIRVIRNLREKGYEIEMDDFGSGYSSLNMLSSMPVDILKMDMAFIRNIEQNEKDLRLVELIVDISGYLKVPVVAEGVENENQLRLLKNVGCDIVQGYYFSRPLSASGFEEKILAKG